jgi:DnaJ-class molecular chaperone
MYCKSCNGSGRKYWSRYGGNDPDVVDVGPCDECSGSGQQVCEYCGKSEAVWAIQGWNQTSLVCESCRDEIQEDWTSLGERKKT